MSTGTRYNYASEHLTLIFTPLCWCMQLHGGDGANPFQEQSSVLWHTWTWSFDQLVQWRLCICERCQQRIDVSCTDRFIRTRRPGQVGGWVRGQPNIQLVTTVSMDFTLVAMSRPLTFDCQSGRGKMDQNPFLDVKRGYGGSLVFISMYITESTYSHIRR